MTRFANKTLLVTGAASGIGKAIAIRAAAEGGRVVVADIAEDGGREVVGQITGSGGQAASLAGRLQLQPT